MVRMAWHLDCGQASCACATKSLHNRSCAATGLLIGSSVLLSALEALASGDPHQHPSKAELTFGDVAPIFSERCIACHRPDGAAPFSLMNYEEVKKRARQIAEVVQSRYMPPWLPESGHVEFKNSRRLLDDEVATITRWVSEGAREGSPIAAPEPHQQSNAWQLGDPDLVLHMSQPYTLPAEGRDVFRNFVIPAGVSSPQFVRAVEFRVKNPRPVHHANLKIDLRQAAREADAHDSEPGFDGVDFIDADFPDGHIIGWTPGKAPYAGFEDLAWRLPPDADLVLMVHMLPTGKPEPIDISIGLHFAKSPPTKQPYSLRLGSQTIDIPPGQKNYEINDSFVLPVDVRVLTIYPHAHYLGREIRADAQLPDQSIQSLLLIKKWDFNWQDEYQYAQPVHLPRGTRIDARMSYDNSASNTANPHQPPQHIVYGPKSSDEMGDVWIQVLPSNANDHRTLTEHFLKKELEAEIAGLVGMLKREPDSYTKHAALARRYLDQGRIDDATKHFQRAIEINATYAAGHCNLGAIYQFRNKPGEAIGCFRRAVQSDPSHAESHLNLGLSLQSQGMAQEAMQHLRRAVELKPTLGAAHAALADALGSRGALHESMQHYQHALRLAPENHVTRQNYAATLLAAGDLQNAREQFRLVLASNPKRLEAHIGLGRTLKLLGDREGALRHFQESLQIQPDNPSALVATAWILSTHPDPALRKPDEAVRHAERAAQLTRQKDATVLETLAAAYASAGRFDLAVGAQETAMSLVNPTNSQTRLNEMSRRLLAFQRGQPLVESPPQAAQR